VFTIKRPAAINFFSRHFGADAHWQQQAVPSLDGGPLATAFLVSN